jgi:callose synthase
MSHDILQQKLAKKDGASIDRQNDIEVLWNFYLEYKSRRRVDDMQREQERMRESGTFSTEYVFLIELNTY